MYHYRYTKSILDTDKNVDVLIISFPLSTNLHVDIYYMIFSPFENFLTRFLENRYNHLPVKANWLVLNGMNYIIYVKYILHFIILRLAHRTSLLTSSKIMIKVFVNVSWHYIKHLYFMWLNFLHLDVRFKLKDILYLIFEPHIYLFVVIKSNPIFSCSMRIFNDLQWSLKLFSTTLRW